MVKFYSKSRTRIYGQNAGSSSDSCSELPKGDSEIKDSLPEITPNQSEFSNRESLPEKVLTKEEEVKKRIQELETRYASLPEEKDPKFRKRREDSKNALLKLEEKRILEDRPFSNDETAERRRLERMVFVPQCEIPEDWLERAREEVAKLDKLTKDGHKWGNKVRLKKEYRKELVDFYFDEVSEYNNFTGTLEEFVSDDQRWEGIVVVTENLSTMLRVRMLNLQFFDFLYGSYSPFVIDLDSKCFDWLADKPEEEDLKKMEYYELDPDCHRYGMRSYIP